MKRIGFRKPATQMSLFPFLAVLICTMGVLIVLLVMLVQQARVAAEAALPEGDSRGKEPAIKQAADDAKWLFDQFVAEHEVLSEEIRDQSAILTDLESHIRELEQQARLLAQKRAALAAVASGKQTDVAQLREQLRALDEVLADAREELERAKQEARRQKPSFAIIPYLGSRGTHRRPVYIECVEDALIIQPEGVRITEEDFGGLIGPGNPLDAALRTIREYYARAGLGGSPYPLLLVRPSGTASYAVARAAMRSWNDEFGYELIDADMPLAYPEPNAALADELRRAVAVARQRQQALAAAMPAAYGRGTGGGGVAYVASRNGGFVAVDSGDQQVNRVGGFGQGADSGFSDGGPGRSTTAPQGSDPGRNDARPGAQGEYTRGNARASGGRSPQSGARTGKNWGLPNSPPPGAVAVTRPIRIAVYHDRLVVLPERGDPDGRLQTIPIYGPLAGHVDSFLSALWELMDSWGLAVVGGYWQPVLHANVQPGGERRYLELQRALRNSGLVLKRVSQ